MKTGTEKKLSECPGRREQNKQKKLERIRSAAHQLFRERGYEGTTTRAVARLAKIGIGTLFLYFPDKSDLLIDIFRDDIIRLRREAIATLPENGTVLDKLFHLFSTVERFFTEEPELVRIYMRETMLRGGKPTYDSAVLLLEFLREVAGVIEDGKKSGEINPDVPSFIAANNLFGSHFMNTLILLQNVSYADQQIKQLRLAFEVQIEGLRPRGNSREGKQ